MSDHAAAIAKALQGFLRESENQLPRLVADPAQSAKAINSVMNSMAPLILIFSGKDDEALTAYMDACMTMLLNEFKKAVVEETIKSGAQDQLDEILARGKK